MNIDLLLQPVEVADHPGLESTDLRLSDIASLAQDGDYSGAAAAAREVFAEGIFDVRLLGFFLYGLFLKEGISNLGEIFGGTAEFLQGNWEASGPRDKRDKHTQTALRWLFNQMNRKLQFEESSQGAAWREWVEKTTVKEASGALEGAEVLEDALKQVLGEAADQLTNGLVKIRGTLHSFLQFVEQQVEAPPGEEWNGVEDEKEDDGSSAASFSAVERDGKFAADGLRIEGSYALGELMQKLEAFEVLMSREKYQQAALVAQDIFEAIENFDPLRYFPKLFRRFFLLYVSNNEELLEFDGMMETREWLLFREYFKVDRDGFIDL